MTDIVDHMPVVKSMDEFFELFPMIDTDECLEWEYGKSNGYGFTRVAGKSTNIPRAVYLHLNPGSTPRVVRHACDNRACYNIKHLLPGTHKDNYNDMVARKRRVLFRGKRTTQTPYRGERVHTSKLSEVVVLEIRRLHVEGVSTYELAAKFGTTRRNINRIVHRMTWTHV